MRDGHLWENIFAMSKGRVVRPDTAVEPEVTGLAMEYNDENDLIDHHG